MRSTRKNCRKEIESEKFNACVTFANIISKNIKDYLFCALSCEEMRLKFNVCHSCHYLRHLSSETGDPKWRAFVAGIIDVTENSIIHFNILHN